MTLTAVLIGGLITYHLSAMIMKASGPLMIFARLRAFLARNQKRAGGFFDALSCIMCTSMYIGFIVALGFASDLREFILYTVSFSAVATVLGALMSQITD